MPSSSRLIHRSINITPNISSAANNNVTIRPKHLQYRAKINLLCNEGKLKEAMQVLQEMDSHGIPVDSDTYASLLQVCTHMKSLEDGRTVHAHLLRSRFKSNSFVGNKLVDMYFKCGSLKSTRQLFDNIPERNVLFWNAIMKEYVNHGLFQEALSVFYQMKEVGAVPDNFTFPLVLKACSAIGDLERGKDIHEDVIRCGFESDIFVGNALVAMYARCGSLQDACQVFDKISQRDTVSWNTMIAAFAQNGHGDDALDMFRQMQLECVKPDTVTFVSVLPACALSIALHQGREVHGYIIKSGFEWDIFVGNANIDMYAKCGEVNDAKQLFDEMPVKDVVSWNAIVAGYVQNGNCDDAQKLFRQMQVEKVKLNVVTWSAMIAGYTQNGHGGKALELFRQMQLAAVEPNSVTVGSLLSACALSEALEQGKELHNYIIRRGLDSNVLLGSAVIDMYAKCKNIEVARRVFDGMSEKNVVSWTVMIGGYAQNGLASQALELCGEMQFLGLKPNAVTIASVLPACARLAAFRQGKEIHNYVLRNGFESVVFVANSLIDVYAKCGNIDLAHQVFNNISEKNIVSWTSMIAGYGMHGFGEDALLVFNQMQQTGMEPDDVIFIAVLSACSHSGLVDEGWRCFDCMTQDYFITPRVEHYACMADLLGRAGLLSEAYEFIKNMPLVPSADVWGALLSACRIHGNVEIGEHVAEYLFNLEPENAGSYVLLSNMYAEAGRWDNVAKVRIRMKEKGLKKKPGCSWIELKNKVHTFFVSDRSHPEMERIYAMLESLSVQMKEGGYVPDTSFVLHDVMDEEKEYVLPVQ